MGDEGGPRGDGALGFDFVNLGLVLRSLSDSIRAFGGSLPLTAQFEREEFLERWRIPFDEAIELFEQLRAEVNMKGTQP